MLTLQLDIEDDIRWRLVSRAEDAGSDIVEFITDLLRAAAMEEKPEPLAIARVAVRGPVPNWRQHAAYLARNGISVAEIAEWCHINQDAVVAYLERKNL